jgi:ribonuclease P protein component
LQVLTKRADFLAANSALRVARGGVVLQARPNGGVGLRFGITVTKRIGNAVVRNRMKRACARWCGNCCRCMVCPIMTMC